MKYRLSIFLAAIAFLWLTGPMGLAAVIPVPHSIEPQKIDRVKPRNVVFVLSDDHRYDAISFMRHPFAVTPHMDSMAANGVHHWEQNYPQTLTHFSLRGDRYKFTTYYGLWDTDELFDIQADPQEQNNLIHDPQFTAVKKRMQDRLYEMMDELGGMDIPMNPPRGNQQNKRLRSNGVHGRGGEQAADFPEAMVVDQPLRKILK